MARNRKFLGYAIILCVLGIIFMFLYSGLQNDQINIIQSYITEEGGGWSSAMTQLPMTVGNFICIALTFVYGTLFIRFGVKKPLIVVMLITAVAVIGMIMANGLDVNGGAASGNYPLFFVSLCIVRCGCMILQMGAFMLVANWFIRYRGQIMGIVTLGSPVFSVVGTSGMTNLIANRFNGDYRPFYWIIVVLIVVVCVIVAVGVKDTPEEAGLYPDGADHAPLSETNESDEIQLTVKQVLGMKKSWLLIVNFGAFQFIINACMGSMAVYYQSLGGLDTWLTATKWLAMGAALGIPMSYVFGFLDDKLGSVKASLILGICEFIPVLCLLFQDGSSVGLMIGWGFGAACMTGGVPTMHPCITSYAFGRREYQSANRIIMAIQLVPSAVAAMMMVSLTSSGNGKLAYGILVVIIIVGLIATIPTLRWKDANAADRMYGDKE